MNFFDYFFFYNYICVYNVYFVFFGLFLFYYFYVFLKNFGSNFKIFYFIFSFYINKGLFSYFFVILNYFSNNFFVKFLLYFLQDFFNYVKLGSNNIIFSFRFEFLLLYLIFYFNSFYFLFNNFNLFNFSKIFFSIFLNYNYLIYLFFYIFDLLFNNIFFIWYWISSILILILPLLLSVAVTTLIERKVMAAIQKRKGPNIVGFFGILQPLSDGLKLIFKEMVIPGVSNLYIFLFSPILLFSLSLMGWMVIPFCENVIGSDLDVSILYILALSSISVYAVILSGWSSNSQYAFLGALRSTAQMISYEVSIGLVILCVILHTGSLSIINIVESQTELWFFVPLFPVFILFLISILAETNRPPFDLPEAEAELVSGYNVEYGSLGFALFFIGEYSNILLMSFLCSLFFLGGWLPLIGSWFYFIPGYVWLILKSSFIVFIFVWVRASFPRYRYDQLMRLGWKVILPLSLGFVLFYGGVVVGFSWFFI